MSEQNEMPDVVYISTDRKIIGYETQDPNDERIPYLRNDYGDDGRVVSSLIVKELDLANARIAELKANQKPAHYDGDWPGRGRCGCEKCLYTRIADLMEQVRQLQQDKEAQR